MCMSTDPSVPIFPSPPPSKTPEHLSFLKKIGQIPHDVGSLQRQMP